MSTSPPSWSTSPPKDDHLPEPSLLFEGEDLEIIVSDSEDQPRPSKPSKKPKKKKNKPSQSSSASRRTLPLPFPSSVTMQDKVLGQMAPKQQLFCPFQAVSKYPYRYIRKTDSEEVSKAYFAGGKLRARGWSIYYIYTGLASTKPLLLVPAIEFRTLLAEINGKLDLRLKFPDDPGFLISFLEDGSPRPRYLGCLSAENSFESMESQIPGPDFKLKGEDEVDPRSFEAFRQKMEAAVEAGKNRSKGSKEKRKKARVLEKKSCCLQLQRTQRYLGMKPLLIDPVTEVLDWQALEEATKKHQEAIAKSRQAIDVTKPIPFAFEQEVVFIAIDVEWFERSNKTITEIGISTLDTADLREIAPGKGCLAWMDQIRARHFRIKEHSHLINTDFVAGCGDRFEAAFGTSEWISLEDAPKVVASCFQLATNSAPRGPDGSPTDTRNEHNVNEPSHSSSLTTVSGLGDENDEGVKAKRNIILVGHDIKADVDRLRAVGFDLSNQSNILEVLDTGDMFRALKHEQQPRSLGAILLDLGLTGWNLHNAGNDAAYTLQAMLGISFKALDVSHERRAAIAAARAIRIKDAAKDAQQYVREDADEWDMVDVEDTTAPEATDTGKFVNPAATRTAEVDAKEEAEAEEAQRIALAAGDDIGDHEPSHHHHHVPLEEKKRIPPSAEAADDSFRPRSISNRNSPNNSSMNAGGSGNGNDSRGPSDIEIEDDAVRPGTHENSLLGAEMLARLKFLDEEDDFDDDGEEGGGGVKL